MRQANRDYSRCQSMLQDVITEFGENPLERRSIKENGLCMYIPPASKPNSKGCAIGMYLSDKAANQIEGSGLINQILIDETLTPYFPKWMLKMDLDFLIQVQELHDGKNYWHDDCISEEGIEKVKDICKEFELDFDKLIFPKYLELSK